MFSSRFQKPLIVTRHAMQRMVERDVDADLVNQIIDRGEIRFSDASRLWAWMHVPDRDDNLICLAAVLEDAVIVKTVMHHWEVGR